MDWKRATSNIQEMCKETFGQSVGYRTSWGYRYVIRGIFEAPHRAVNLGSGPEASMTAPTLGIKLCDLPEKPAKGDQVTVDSTDYKVIDSLEDGEGGVTLILHRI